MSQAQPGRRHLRVLQVMLSLDPGGTERLLLDLVSRLHVEWPMAVCCLDHEGRWARDLPADVQVSALGRHPGFRPVLGRRLAAVARQHRADILHAHHYSPFVYSCAARLFGCRTPIVFTEHGRLTAGPALDKRRIVNQVLRFVPSAVVAVSADLKAHMVMEGFRARDIEVVHNGIDIGTLPTGVDRAAVRRELGLGDDEFVAGTVARLDPVKDLETIIEAAAAAGGGVSSLVIVGDGPDRERLEKLARARSGSLRVVFTGQRDDARRLLAGLDVFVNTSLSEGISLTILEAMAAGLPVVATRVGGTPEILDDKSGRLVPPGASSAVAAALEELRARPDRRRALGASARERVVQHFSLDRMVNAYQALYFRAAGERAAAGG